MRSDGIHPNVLGLCNVILGVSDGPLMKSGLPDLHGVTPDLVNLVRAAAFDQLQRLFQRRRIAWRQEQVKVVWHYDKLVQEIGALVVAGDEASRDNVGHLGNAEERAVLPGLCGYEVGARRRCSM